MAADPPVRRSPALKGPVARPGRSGRILLVDDDFALRASLAELLHGEGYTVVCAADGVEALGCLDENPGWVAILLDIMLPRMGGIEVRQLQMRSSGLRAVPTIALTSLRDIAHLQTYAFDAVFRKPIDTERLVQTLNDIRASRQ